MADVFLTGFPGFLGTALLQRLLRARPPEASVACLVQPAFIAHARARVQALTAQVPEAAGRVRIVEGDITAPDLGLGDAYAPLADRAAEVFHLAALYDLGLARPDGLRVNVEGTRNVIAFAARAPKLRRLHYVSTCYVSGRHPGVFAESDLDVGQSFNNHYEETKFLAEVAVQQAGARGLPTTIYRPSIVVGDSRTGATQKFDGPYSVVRWILRWQRVAPVPVIGAPAAHTVNLVPSDFVADALAYLSARPDGEGTVYHLSDPTPPTVQALLDLMADATGRRLVPIRLPLGLAQAALRYAKPLRQWLQIPPEAVPYYVHPTTYACTNTLRALSGSGIECPPIERYFHRLVAFARRNPTASVAAPA